MPKLTIDGIEVEIEPGLTVLQACEAAGIEIPRFCYHERLSIAGNCRMCLVAMEGGPKLIASCAMPAADGMKVITNTPKVQRARKSVMEFLLINHPLDCPICDQGGECDLQDQAMAFGFDRGRFEENKRSVEDKNFGPLVKTSMTRCIHCTRCIRFATEVAGVPELGATGRGEFMEVGTYVEKALTSELSGNLIDLCPVGALTSKPYAYVARPWELSKTETIDVMDAVGSNIRIDARGREVLRVLPRVNDDINEEWISDKTRFACDGLRRQRLDRPYIRENGRLRPAKWPEALRAVAGKLNGIDGRRVGAIIGDLADAEAMVALKDLMTGIGSPNIDCRQDGARLSTACRAGYLFNATISGIEQADALLIVGSNPRVEAAVLNARIRKRYRVGNFPIAVVGPQADLTYRYTWHGADPTLLVRILNEDHDIARMLGAAKRPMIILGMGALARPDGAAIHFAVRELALRYGVVRPEEGWNGFSVLHTAAARVGGLDLGLVPGAGGLDVAGMIAAARQGDLDALFLLGADEIPTGDLGNAFVVYQGHHGDAGAHRADVILPGAAYPEKDGTYVNTEGRVQRAYLGCFPPGDAREDWTILRALSDVMGRPLPYDSLEAVRARLEAVNPVFATVDAIVDGPFEAFGEPTPVMSAALTPAIENFYLTNPICRASVTMAECSELFLQTAARKTGTHG